MSNHLWFCNSAWNASSYYFIEKSKDFSSFGHFFLSFLQNMLGRIIDITNISQSIEDAVLADNLFGIHYNAARLTRILVFFDPIELIDDDSDFT